MISLNRSMLSDFPARIVVASIVIELLLLAMHLGVYILSSFEAQFPVLPVFLSLGLFWSVLAVTAAVMLCFSRRGLTSTTSADDYLQQLVDLGLLGKLMLITLIGLCLHIFAKHFLTTIRPVSCLFEIRFAWIEVGHDGLPTHVRIASILGHLLTSFAYSGTLLSSWAVVRPPRGANRFRMASYQLGFLTCGVVFSGFIGSRNAMLAFVVTGFFGVLIALSVPRFSWPALFRAAPVFILPVAIGLAFSSAVFSDRMFCDMDTSEGEPSKAAVVQASNTYMSGFYDEFSIRQKSRQPEKSASVATVLEQHCSICGPTFLYINHGVINLAQVMATEHRGDHILFRFAEAIANRLGILELEENPAPTRVFGPGGLPLAGAAFHDYGWQGLVAVAVFLGTVLGIGSRMLASPGFRFGIGLVLVTSCFYTLALSNMFVAPSVISFPFIVFSLSLSFVIFPWLARQSVRMGTSEKPS